MKTIHAMLTNCMMVSFLILGACNTSVTKNKVKTKDKLAYTSPFKSVSLPKEYFVIQPNVSQVITTQNGSKIYIDSLSLVDKDGIKIKEPVTLQLQTIMNPAEMLTSGIPMKYSDSENKDVPFQSAGMFEIQATTASGQEVMIDQHHPIKMDLSSYSSENGFSNYMLDKKTGRWTKTEEETKIPNMDKEILSSQLAKLKSKTAFNNELFVLDFYSLLDEFLNNNVKEIYSYYDNPKKAIPKRLLKYGVDAERIICYDQVELNENKLPAYCIVWESVDRKKFPNWKKASYAKLLKKADNVYELTCSNQDDKTETFTTLIRPKMTIKSLFKFGPEKWDSNYAETLKEIQEQERTLAKMNDVKRTLTISQFGVFNCDRFYKNPEAFEAKVELEVPKGKNGFVPERYFYVSKRDKLSIDYAFSKKLLLFQDKTAALYTVLEGDVLAKVDTEQLLKCSKDDPTTQKLIFKPVTKINNTNELKELMGI
jgi:hypothetical protein